MIETQISRDKDDRKKMAVVKEGGRNAITEYEVVERFGKYTIVKCKLKTGRTHQIRVHMAYIGCPLFNDNLYGTPGPQSRHALHAFKLRFIHPVSDTPVEITRTLPEDLRRIIYY